MKKALAIVAVLVVVLGGAYSWQQVRSTSVDASIYIGALTCGVELKGAAMPELLRCADVPTYLREHLAPGSRIALGYVGGRDDARAQELSTALSAAGYKQTLTTVVAKPAAQQP